LQEEWEKKDFEEKIKWIEKLITEHIIYKTSSEESLPHEIFIANTAV
jgi:hypothetical protein